MPRLRSPQPQPRNSRQPPRGGQQREFSMPIPPIGRLCVSRGSLMLPKQPEPRMRGLVHVLGLGDFLVNPAVCAELPQRTIGSWSEGAKSRLFSGPWMVPRCVGHNRVTELGLCCSFCDPLAADWEGRVLGPRAAHALPAAHRTRRHRGFLLFPAAPFRGVSHGSH